MEILRQIGNETILVNCIEPNEISLKQSTLEKHHIQKHSLSEIEVCELLSTDKYIPLMLEWELLDKCSFKCPFCYIVGHSEHKIIRFNKVKDTINQIIEDGMLYCKITGGEATMHPDFKEIYKFLKENGVIVEIYTNGSLIDAEIIELFEKYKPYKVEITTYGLSNEVFASNTCSKISPNIILDNILNLKNKGIYIVCKTPLNKGTVKEFDSIRNWCKQNNIVHYYSTDVYNGFDGENLQNWTLEKDVIAKYDAEKLISNTTEEELTNYVSEKVGEKSCFSCAVKKYGLYINSGFELAPCSTFRISESKFDFNDLGYDNAIRRYRDFVNEHLGRKIEGCVGCSASSFCKMCPAKANPVYNTNGKVTAFKVPQEHCDKMREKANLLVETILTS